MLNCLTEGEVTPFPQSSLVRERRMGSLVTFSINCTCRLPFDADDILMAFTCCLFNKMYCNKCEAGKQVSLRIVSGLYYYYHCYLSCKFVYSLWQYLQMVLIALLFIMRVCYLSSLWQYFQMVLVALLFIMRVCYLSSLWLYLQTVLIPLLFIALVWCLSFLWQYLQMVLIALLFIIRVC